MATRKETPNVLDELFNPSKPTQPSSQPTQLRIGDIRVDGGTQMRAELDKPTIEEYHDVLYAQDQVTAWPFPPVVVFYDGADYWLGDGFHRLAAVRKLLPNNDVYSVPAEVKAGTRRDAVLYAASANSDHGLRRTRQDKIRSVETLLRDEEWAGWSDNEIARRCHVSPTFVGNIRRAVTIHVDSETPEDRQFVPVNRTYTTKHGTTATMQTGAIGTKPQRQAQPSVSPEQRQYAASVAAMSTPEAPVATMPEDLAARGWQLRQLTTGRYYANNTQGSKATDVFDSAVDAIAAARSMQIDVRQPVSVEAITGGKLLVDLTDADWAAVADKEAFAYAKQRLYTAMAAMREAMVKLDGHHDELAAGIKVMIDDLGRLVGELE